MSFSDLTFLFYFLPLFFAVYYLVPFRCKNAVLVLGSAAFYFLGAGVRDCVLLGASVVLHYALARGMEGRTLCARRALLVFLPPRCRRICSASSISSTLHFFLKTGEN